MVRVVICGGGNGAHVLAGLSGGVPGGIHVTILTVPDEADKIRRGIHAHGGIHVTGTNAAGAEIDVRGAPAEVTSEMKGCVPEADLIILTLPAFVHQRILSKMQPLLKPGVTIVGMPGRPGFEFELKSCLGDKWSQTSFLTTLTLPWACRILEYGAAVKIFGTKVIVSTAAVIRPETGDINPVALLQKLVGEQPQLKVDASPLKISLICINAIIHPPIMYGSWAEWDGEPISDVPLFYQSMTQKTAHVMDMINDELKTTSKTLGGPEIPSPLDILKDFYDEQIKDASSLLSAVTTNSAYCDLKQPVVETSDGKFVPNFKFRYLTEDIPFGLCVAKGMAVIAGVDTPTLDRVLRWAQEKIGKQYLTDSGDFAGKDIGESRAPQRFGIHTKEQLLAFEHSI